MPTRLLPNASQEPVSRLHFTKSNIRTLALPQGRTDFIWWDDAPRQLGIRIRAKGSRNWIAQYRVRGTGQQRRLTWGPVDAQHSLDDARAWAWAELAKVGLGRDPQAERRKATSTAALTMASILGLYLDRQRVETKPTSFRETERYLRKVWAPLHRRPMNAIGPDDIGARMNQLRTRPASAYAAWGALAAFFTWAMAGGSGKPLGLTWNPVLATAALRPPKPAARDRVLDAAELRAVWQAAGDDDFGRIVRLLILTGQREAEVGGMAWTEIDLAGGTWTIPSDRTKNGLTHHLPLPEQALAILRSTSPIIGRDTVFGRGANGFRGWSKAKLALDGRAGLQPWRLHDLRRTAATRMHDLGILPHVVEAILNHVSGSRAGVAGVYNRAEYLSQKREALERWAAHVAETCG